MYWVLPVLLVVNMMIGPWKVFRASIYWISGYNTFTNIWTTLWEQIVLNFTNVWLLISVPFKFFIQFFGIPIELLWLLMQLVWWLFMQNVYVTAYNFSFVWEVTAMVYAASLYVNYKYNDFISSINTNVSDSFWVQILVLFVIVAFWPVIVFVMYLIYFFYGWFGWCAPYGFCYSFQWPTGANV